MRARALGRSFFRIWTPLFLAVLGECSPVAAQRPVSSSGGAITLAQAVEITLARDPELALSRSALEADRGRFEETKGVFDTFFTGSLKTDRVERTLLSQTLVFEQGKRDLFRQLNQNLTQLADDLEQQLADPGRLPILRCPPGIEAVLVGSLNICMSDIEAARREAEDDRLRLLIELATNPEERARLEEARRQQLEAARPVAEQVLRVLRQEASVAAQELRNLGALPKYEELYALTLDLRVGKTFRTGLRPACGVILQSVRDGYVGKPLQAAYGGKGVPNSFSVFEGCQLDTPLARGFGRASVGAQEEEARAHYRASLAQLGHAHAERTLNVITAYWQAAAAWDRRALFEHTVKLEEQLEGDVRGLVKGEETPASELSRVAGRLAAARQSLAQARAAEIAARVDLATAMGLVLHTPNEAPVPADPLPEPSLPPVADAHRAELVDHALALRSDLAASRALEESAEVLTRAARNDLKPALDLQLQAGFFARHQSFSEGYYSYEGFRRAFGANHAGPSFNISFKLVLPPANREAEGRLIQAQALRDEAGVRRREVARRIRNGVVEAIGSLDRANAEAAARDLSAAGYERTFGNTRELLTAGEATLVDTVLTEEQWTQSRLDAIDARLAFALLSARLRFEAGTLISYHERDGQLIVDPDTPYGHGL